MYFYNEKSCELIENSLKKKVFDNKKNSYDIFVVFRERMT